MARDHLNPTPPNEPAAAVADEPSELLLSRPTAKSEPHGVRFRVAYALLAVVLGAAVGGFIVLVGRGGSGSHAPWSKWQPEGSGLLKTQQIASHVGTQYRLSSGKELVAVIPRIPPTIQPSGEAVPISNIVFAPTPDPQDISVYPTGNSVEYFLCGIGSPSGRCAIGEGKATVERGRLLRQESLELALYTFKYVDDVDSVVTLQPPKAGQSPTYALFFKKDDFGDALDRPLAQTLRGIGPYSVDDFTPVRAAAVARIVSPHIFRFSYQQAPDGSALLVLQPPAA